MPLLITTAVRAGPEQVARATMLAQRMGAERFERTGPIRDKLREGNLLYVVGRERDRLCAGETTLSLNEGLLRARLHAGTDHPLIATMAPSGDARRVVDGTIGLAGDALHLAGALGCEVVGIEVSPVLFSLLEEGLPRLTRSRHTQVADAASRVQPKLGDCAEVMAGMTADSADAVLLAPMYPSPHKAAPGFELLRSVADHRPLTSEQVRVALEVAPRLVVKWPRGRSMPEALAPYEPVLRAGHRVDYWLATRASD